MMIHVDALKREPIRNGRAMVQGIEGLKILKEDSGAWRETSLLKLTLDLYRYRLERTLDDVPTNVRAKVFNVSQASSLPQEILSTSRTRVHT